MSILEHHFGDRKVRYAADDSHLMDAVKHLSNHSMVPRQQLEQYFHEARYSGDKKAYFQLEIRGKPVNLILSHDDEGGYTLERHHS